MIVFSPEWRAVHVNPKLQEFLTVPPPKGFGTIYAIVRKQDLRGYVGQTVLKWIDRHRQHWYCKTAYVSNALRKYGKDAFDFLILDLVPLDELDEMEARRISDCGTQYPLGFNLHSGGTGGRYANDPATLERKRQSMKAALANLSAEEKERRIHLLWKGRDAMSKEAIQSKMDKINEKLRNKSIVEKEETSNRQKLAWTNRSIEKKRAAVDKRKDKMVGIHARKVETARASALPFEPDVQKRIHLQYYIKDGVLVRWHSTGKVPRHVAVKGV